jgi:hypothetical protein
LYLLPVSSQEVFQADPLAVGEDGRRLPIRRRPTAWQPVVEFGYSALHGGDTDLRSHSAVCLRSPKQAEIGLIGSQDEAAGLSGGDRAAGGGLIKEQDEHVASDNVRSGLMACFRVDPPFHAGWLYYGGRLTHLPRLPSIHPAAPAWGNTVAFGQRAD